ncbi:MAG: GGDEF domain-containing protein [Candidatus Phosphoribacter sp.]|nr:GGDEF domain-containing protein [Actinomycetales bacterium]
MTISPRAGEKQEAVVAAQTLRSPEDAVSSVLDATRALLWVDSAEQVAALAAKLVTALGGTLTPAQEAPYDCLPIDLSFGIGAPQLPTLPDDVLSRKLFERHLVGFARDAHQALELLDRPKRLAEDASLDALTGLANRRMLGRALGRVAAEDAIIMIDLDHFKGVNDAFGHDQGDRVLCEFGGALRATTRAADRAVRFGGEEFVVLLAAGDPEAFLLRLRHVWEDRRPRRVTFSAGIALARTDPWCALGAADRALYRAKDAGRDQWQWAVTDDYQ